MTTYPTINSRVQKGSSGSVITLVLVFIVILSFVVVAFLEEATSRIKYFGLFHNSDDLRVDAYSALDLSLAVVNEYREIEGELWGPAQGWGNPLSRLDFEPNNAQSISVSFKDEGGKIPISSLNYDLLMRLFDILDFDLATSQELADSLLDWTDDDDLKRLNGFDGEDYEKFDPPYKASNRPIETWDEFVLINGFKDHFFDKNGKPLPVFNEFKNSISLYHRGSININKASPLILDLLDANGTFDRTSYDYYKNGADGIPNTEDDRIAKEPDQYVTGELPDLDLSGSIETLLVEIKATRGEAEFILQALVSWVGSNPAANSIGQEDEAQEPQQKPESQPDNSEINPRGSAKTKSTSGAELGYPFKIIKLLENQKI